MVIKSMKENRTSPSSLGLPLICHGREVLALTREAWQEAIWNSPRLKVLAEVPRRGFTNPCYVSTLCNSVIKTRLRVDGYRLPMPRTCH